MKYNEIINKMNPGQYITPESFNAANDQLKENTDYLRSIYNNTLGLLSDGIYDIRHNLRIEKDIDGDILNKITFGKGMIKHKNRTVLPHVFNLSHVESFEYEFENLPLASNDGRKFRTDLIELRYKKDGVANFTPTLEVVEGFEWTDSPVAFHTKDSYDKDIDDEQDGEYKDRKGSIPLFSILLCAEKIGEDYKIINHNSYILSLIELVGLKSVQEVQFNPLYKRTINLNGKIFDMFHFNPLKPVYFTDEEGNNLPLSHGATELGGGADGISIWKHCNENFDGLNWDNVRQDTLGYDLKTPASNDADKTVFPIVVANPPQDAGGDTFQLSKINLLTPRIFGTFSSHDGIEARLLTYRFFYTKEGNSYFTASSYKTSKDRVEITTNEDLDSLTHYGFDRRGIDLQPMSESRGVDNKDFIVLELEWGEGDNLKRELFTLPILSISGNKITTQYKVALENGQIKKIYIFDGHIKRYAASNSINDNPNPDVRNDNIWYSSSVSGKRNTYTGWPRTASSAVVPYTFDGTKPEGFETLEDVFSSDPLVTNGVEWQKLPLDFNNLQLNYNQWYFLTVSTINDLPNEPTINFRLGYIGDIESKSVGDMAHPHQIQYSTFIGEYFISPFKLYDQFGEVSEEISNRDDYLGFDKYRLIAFQLFDPQWIPEDLLPIDEDDKDIILVDISRGVILTRKDILPDNALAARLFYVQTYYENIVNGNIDTFNIIHLDEEDNRRTAAGEFYNQDLNTIKICKKLHHILG